MSNRNILKVRKKTDPNFLATYTFNSVDASPHGADGPRLIVKGVIADATRNPKLKQAIRRKYQRLFDSLNLQAQREQQRLIKIRRVQEKMGNLNDELDAVEFDYNEEVAILTARMVADLFPIYVIRDWNVVDANGVAQPYDKDAQADMTSVLEEIDIEDLLLFSEFFKNRLNFQVEPESDEPLPVEHLPGKHLETPLTKEEGVELGNDFGS